MYFQKCQDLDLIPYPHALPKPKTEKLKILSKQASLDCFIKATPNIKWACTMSYWYHTSFQHGFTFNFWPCIKPNYIKHWHLICQGFASFHQLSAPNILDLTAINQHVRGGGGVAAAPHVEWLSAPRSNFSAISGSILPHPPPQFGCLPGLCFSCTQLPGTWHLACPFHIGAPPIAAG